MDKTLETIARWNPTVLEENFDSFVNGVKKNGLWTTLTRNNRAAKIKDARAFRDTVGERIGTIQGIGGRGSQVLNNIVNPRGIYHNTTGNPLEAGRKIRTGKRLSSADAMALSDGVKNARHVQAVRKAAQK